jgi:peptidoglycan hydrolase-like protein with peptidoglycan-binding domain
MALRSSLFKGNTRLEAAASSAPPLRWGETGYGVMAFQSGLLQLGYALPISTRKLKGAPDGVYGDETFAAVKRFQKDRKLKEDGIAGRQTVTTMDGLLPPAKLPAPKPPAPPLPGPVPKPGPKPPPPPPTGPRRLPESDKFKIGIDDPPLKPDKGAGVWNSEPTSPQSYFVAYLVMNDVSFLAACWVAIGDDATKHLVHYFRNTGADYTIDLEGMLADVKRARTVFHQEIADMVAYVEQLPPDYWAITSKHVTQNRDTYNYQGENRNWFFAIGGYSVWGKGAARVGANGTFELDYEYKFFDRYNWDGGKSVTIAGVTITDEWMGRFHREGVAREFNCYGSVKRTLRWTRTAPLDVAAIVPV